MNNVNDRECCESIVRDFRNGRVGNMGLLLRHLSDLYIPELNYITDARDIPDDMDALRLCSSQIKYDCWKSDSVEVLKEWTVESVRKIAREYNELKSKNAMILAPLCVYHIQNGFVKDMSMELMVAVSSKKTKIKK